MISCENRFPLLGDHAPAVSAGRRELILHVHAHPAARFALGHLHAEIIGRRASAHPRPLLSRRRKGQWQPGRFRKRAFVVAQDLRLRQLLGNRTWIGSAHVAQVTAGGEESNAREGDSCPREGERGKPTRAKVRTVMEAHAVNSEPDIGPCGRCEHCRCGEKSAAPPQIETAFRAVHATVSPSASITAMPAVGGAESRFYPAARVGS